MDAGAELLKTLGIMFSVVIFGLVIIIGIFIVSPRWITDPGFIAALVFSVFVTFCAWSFIRVKMYVWRKGFPDQIFPVMQIHLFEIVSSLTVLLILQFYMRPDILQHGGTKSWKEIFCGWFSPMTRPSIQLFLVGLAAVGYGMGVFFSSDQSVPVIYPVYIIFYYYIITNGLIVVNAYRPGAYYNDLVPALMAGLSLTVYLLVLLVATYSEGSQPIGARD